MDLKSNINRIHSDLTNTFDSVLISEKANSKMGNYFEIVICEGFAEAKVIVKYNNLGASVVHWSHYSNPLDNESTLIDRSSLLENLSYDIKEIFEKNRFSSEYIKVLESKKTNEE
jgi:hypothetical protein